MKIYNDEQESTDESKIGIVFFLIVIEDENLIKTTKVSYLGEIGTDASQLVEDTMDDKVKIDPDVIRKWNSKFPFDSGTSWAGVLRS